MASGSFFPDFPTFLVALWMIGIRGQLPPAMTGQHAVDRGQCRRLPHFFLNHRLELWDHNDTVSGLSGSPDLVEQIGMTIQQLE